MAALCDDEYRATLNAHPVSFGQMPPPTGFNLTIYQYSPLYDELLGLAAGTDHASPL